MQIDMAPSNSNLPEFTDADLTGDNSSADSVANRFTNAALEAHKREGLELAVKARWAALAVIALLLLFLDFSVRILYYEFLLAVLALIGWLQRRIGQVGQSSKELFLLFLELTFMTVVLALPNPLDDSGWPAAMIYRFGTFGYFFVILAAGTMAYSWRTIMAIGNWTVALWMLAAAFLWWFGYTDPSLTAATQSAFPQNPIMAQMLDPNYIDFGVRVQESVIFLIVAFMLALSVRRFNRLLLENAALERERSNLSRYFSPNVVESLSRNDEPLKQTRTHDVAVLFVDIVGFTSFASDMSPEKLIETLRGFHARMEAEVFNNQGTLDKYLGDGLMATFGTPTPGDLDATRALACARNMLAQMELWNAERAEKNEPPVQISIGLHYGSVVLGDIGANRLEFAVLGNTVNVASRLERLTRSLDTRLVMSGALIDQIREESSPEASVLAGIKPAPDQNIRGISGPMPVWVCD